MREKMKNTAKKMNNNFHNYFVVVKQQFLFNTN